VLSKEVGNTFKLNKYEGVPGVFFKKLVASTWGCVGTGKKVFKKNPRNTLNTFFVFFNTGF
jgi:hypothetical protein